MFGGDLIQSGIGHELEVKRTTNHADTPHPPKRMKMPPRCREVAKRRVHKGMTLMELTVIILVLLSLIAIMFVGARSWKQGSDRSACIMNIRKAQLLVRGYQNVMGLADHTPINMFTDILGPAGASPTCPAGGNYDHIGHIPPPGELVMWCDLAASQEHVPDNHSDW
jgi:type II secretory pathway pseudopilin PulG